MMMNDVENRPIRNWEQWDRKGISQMIDTYWLASHDEAEHRKKLSTLVQKWMLPEERILEVGCGSGLVYKEFVSSFLPPSAYTGVDISDAMLEIATRRFPEGVFYKGDLYRLSFPDDSFDLVAAFEVMGHIVDLTLPIQEMFRTASRLAIFTAWTGAETKISHELIGDAVFLHKTYTQEDLCNVIEESLDGKSYILTIEPVSQGITAFLIHKTEA
jgi:SAM-dependent methyltransferase